MAHPKAPKRNRSRRNDVLHGDTRKKIQVTQIVNRLAANTMGSLTNQNGDHVEMSQGQLKSADILLKKALPDLSATEITGIDGSPLIPALNIARASD